MVAKVFAMLPGVSLTAGIFILFVALMRVLFRRMPRRVFVLLWMMAGLRLLVPAGIESPVSARGFLERSPHTARTGILRGGKYPDGRALAFQNPAAQAQTVDDSGTAAGAQGSTDTGAHDSAFTGWQDGTAAGVHGGAFTGWSGWENSALFATKSGVTDIPVLGWVWLGGAAAVLAYGLYRYLSMRMRLRDAVRLTGNVWQSDRIQTPFLLGILRPRIYVPFGLGEKLSYVIVHERMHIKGGDHILKLLWYLVLAMYWFHPLVWLAYALLGRDMELACDERVVSAMSEEQKGGYARALFEISSGEKTGVFHALTFGEVGVKMRVMHILSYKKPAAAGAVVCFGLGLFVAAVLLTDPESSAADAVMADGKSAKTEDHGNDKVTDHTAAQESADWEIADEKTADEKIADEKIADEKIADMEIADVEILDHVSYSDGRWMDMVDFGKSCCVDLDGDGQPEYLDASFTSAPVPSLGESDAERQTGYLVLSVKSESGEEKASAAFAADGLQGVLPGESGSGNAVPEESRTVARPDGNIQERILENPRTDHFYVMDIERGDSYLEIGFYQDGPSGDPETLLMRYADGELAYIGSFSAGPGEAGTEIPGNGCVTAVTRCDILQTDWILGTWQIKDGQMVYQEPSEGEFLCCDEQYQSDIPVTARDDFVTHLQDPLSSAVARVSKGTKLGIESFRREGSLIVVNFFYEESDGSRVEACFQMEGVNGKIQVLSGSYDFPDDLLEGLNHAG